jgi:signal transduction histidine kinase/DNA-binding NarL/FixJ family response regulator
MQNIQSRIPLKSLKTEPAVTLKTEGKPITILLINGNQKEAYLIRKTITESVKGVFALECADRLSVGIERLARGDINVILLDLTVPDGRGLESLTQVRAKAVGIPIIVLSPLDNEKDKIEALKRGAQEYLVKGNANSDLLVRTIYRAIAGKGPAPNREQKTPRSESAESQFNNIIKSHPDGIIIVDQKGAVCFTNPAVEALFGCKAEQLLGESLDSLRAVEGGKTELGIVRGDGEKRVAEVRVVEMQYRGETAYLASLRDITERKKAEEETKLVFLEAEAIKTNSVKVIAKSSEEARLVKEQAEEVKVSSARAIAKASEEARLAGEETEEVKATSAKAIAKANEESKLVRKEIEEVKAASAKAIAKANEEAKLAKKEIEEVKAASAKAIAKANEEAKLAKKEIEEVKAASAKAIAKANEEARLASKEIEEVKANSARVIAKVNEEAKLAKKEIEEVKAASAKANEEVQLAREEAEAVKKTSAKAVSKAKEEARLAQEEAEAASDKAITKAKEMARLAREEAETTSARAINKATEEARLAREEAEAVKTASTKAVVKANKEARLAREEAEELKETSTQAIAKAAEETRLAQEEAEAVRTASAKAIEEARLAREEAETVKAASTKAAVKANKEAKLAREEAEEIKTVSAKNIAKSSEEASLAKEEAEEAKKTSAKAITKTTEEARLAREEAEEVKTVSAKAVARANEEARLALEEVEATRAASEEVIARAAEKRYNLDPMQSEFMSNIVHELRAPLHSILAFTKLLLEDDVSNIETQKEFLSIIASQSEHLRKLVDELIDISPIESERFDIIKERVAIGNMLQSSLRDFSSMARQKNIVMHEYISPQLPDVEVDSQRLKQVMFNLLDNAIKFSNDGGSIDISAEVEGADLMVRVTDYGIGIAEEAMKSIFEKFYQVKNTTRAGGLGLGLYISRRIIEAHGGRIWAESIEGTGTTFSFTIPLKQVDR